MYWFFYLIPFFCVAVLLAADAPAQTTFELNESGEFVPVEEPNPATPEGQLMLIRRELVEGSASRAEAMADDWLEDYPFHPLEPEAYLIRGDAKLARDRQYLALADYETIIGLYPGTQQYRTAIEREYEIAKLFVNGLYRRWIFGLRVLPGDDIGVELLIRVQERLPGSALGEKASMAIGDYYFGKGDMELATEAYDLFLVNYPRSRQREWAILRLIQASLARFKGPQFDPTGLTEAAQRIRQYKAEFPAAADRIGADALLVRITESLASKDLEAADWHDERGLDYSAVVLYRRLIVDYPQTQAAWVALARLEELGAPLVDPRDPASRARPGRGTPAPQIGAEIEEGE
ncbi:MAG: outer membrane protein assembly factor BamD [Planctomycetota bacterium]